MKTNENCTELWCAGALCHLSQSTISHKNELRKVVFSCIRAIVKQRKTEYSGVLITIYNYISKKLNYTAYINALFIRKVLQLTPKSYATNCVARDT